jgi:hypothetical protein
MDIEERVAADADGAGFRCAGKGSLLMSGSRRRFAGGGGFDLSAGFVCWGFAGAEADALATADADVFWGGVGDGVRVVFSPVNLSGAYHVQRPATFFRPFT